METIDLLKSHAKEIKTCFNVKRIGLFGSFARGEQKESSDIDVLVEFEEPTFRNFMNHLRRMGFRLKTDEEIIDGLMEMNRVLPPAFAI